MNNNLLCKVKNLSPVKKQELLSLLEELEQAKQDIKMSMIGAGVGFGVAGIPGSYIDAISSEIGLNGVFAIFALVPIGAGLIMFLLNGKIKRMMHGIK